MRSKRYVQSRWSNLAAGDSEELGNWRNTSLNSGTFPTTILADSSMSCGSGLSLLMDCIFRNVMSMWLGLEFRSVKSIVLNCMFCSLLTPYRKRSWIQIMVILDLNNVSQEIIVSFLISGENYRGVTIGKKGTNCPIIFPRMVIGRSSQLDHSTIFPYYLNHF